MEFTFPSLMKSLANIALTAFAGTIILISAEAKALTYTVGGSASSIASVPPAGRRLYTLDTNVLLKDGIPATGDVATAFDNFLYKVYGGPVNATCSTLGKSCPLSWATPLTLSLPATATFGSEITFENPLIVKTNPLAASNTFAGFGTFTTSSGATGSLSFTVNPATAWGGTLELNLTSAPGPLPAAGAVAAFSFSRRMRRRIDSSV
ncbi:MAG: hypothetical protein ACKOZW_07825 [Cyanobium sp.]